MDIFERKETYKFSQLLRVKLRSKKEGKPLDTLPLYNRVKVENENQVKQLAKRNNQIRRALDQEKQGLAVNYTLYEEEAQLFKTMRLSKQDRFCRLRDEFEQKVLKHLDRPHQLSTDYVLARAFLLSCFIVIDDMSLVGYNDIDDEYKHFKFEFDQRLKDQNREKFVSIVKQIHTLRSNIMSAGAKQDMFEHRGFQYNEDTYESIFSRNFNDGFDAQSESSEEEEQPQMMPEPSIKDESPQQIEEEKVVEDSPEIPQEEEKDEFDPESVPAHQFNWFRYLIETKMVLVDDAGNQLTALKTSDSYINLLNIIISNKVDDEISNELLDMLGFDNIELVMSLVQKRDGIKQYVGNAKEILNTGDNQKQSNYNKTQQSYIPSNDIVVYQNPKKPKGNKKVEQYEKMKVSNYDLLAKLGFPSHLIDQNKVLGLKPKTTVNMQEFFQFTEETGGTKGQKFEKKKEQQNENKVYAEENEDYKFIEIAPPPKQEMDKKDFMKIADLPPFARQAFGYTKTLNQIQTIVYPCAFKSSRSMIIAAPTGAGKTNVALLTILNQVATHFKDNEKGPWDCTGKNFQVIYIAPLKALAAEIVDKFQKALGYLNIKIAELTGDMSIPKSEIAETHIIVATPEKWDVVTRKTDGMMDRVSCLIIDEIHLLNDERGLVLECLVSRAITTGLKNQKPIRIVGLSATLPNYYEVADFIGATDESTFYFDGSYRPTPLKCGFYGIREQTNPRRLNNIMNDIIYENIKRMLKNGKQVIIFAHKRGETYTTALELIEFIKENSGDRELFECEDSWKSKKNVDRSQNLQVKDLFEFGFSIHHAGMLRKDRNLVESLFNQGHIKILCSTATLAWGVNLPAYGVIIKGTKVYNSNIGGYNDIGIFDVQQIFGRAGRPQFDTEGEGIILTSHKEVDEYVRMMSNKQNVESHLVGGLDNAFNAEITAGIITNVTEGVQWLKKTFFFQRVKKNPIQYGRTWQEIKNDPSGNSVMLDMATKSIERLNRQQLIRYNLQTQGVFPTDMGRIACNYYINCQTMSYFMSNFQPEQQEHTFLYHLAQASEFKQLEARKDELEELKTLVTLMKYVEVDKKCYNEAHSKVLIMLECYLRKITIKTFSLISDMAYVAQNMARLMRAAFEICMQKNYANLAKISLNWCKIIDRRLQPGDHPMKQFCIDSWYGKLTGGGSEKAIKHGYLKDDTVYRLKQFNISLDDISERNLQEAKRYMSPDHQDQLYRFAGHIPYFDISIRCQPITRSILKVQLWLMPDFEWNDRWNGKTEPFWIMIDNESEVLHSEFFTVSKKDIKSAKQARLRNEAGINLTFFIPYQVEQGQNRISCGEYYNMTILSDRWFDISYYKTIHLSELEVPDEDFPNTKLLPLRPLSIKTLGDPKFEELYASKFRFFNPVQTQVFHTLYHTDSNVLIGAPTGSGKTIMSELSMLRVFKHTPKRKIIFIAPLKALAKERIIDWKKRLQQGSLQKSVLELTGDVTPDLKALQTADVLITTPEKWDGISRNWQSRSYVSAVALVIIDEIHLLGQERGPVIEVIVSRMRYISEQTGNNIRFVGLSTALANAKDVADWMGIHRLGLFNFKPSVRPVPIKVFFEGFTEKHYCPRMATMNRPCYKAINTHSRNHPVLIFVSSRRQTRLTALDLLAMCAAEIQEAAMNTDNPSAVEFKLPFLHMEAEEIAQIAEYIKDENLAHCIQYGVGMHHAGLTESDRKIVEELFVKKKIQVLVTTSTLAWGVNFPARLVIVKGTEFYDANLKRYVDFPLTDLLQMIGRAGRPQFDDCGIACVMVSEEKKNFYKKFLYEPFPVESSLADQLTDHLNAEIASGTLQKMQHCIDYLTWTYFFRRLTKNPAYYGLQVQQEGDESDDEIVEKRKRVNTADEINAYLKKLIMKSVDKLIKAGCVEYSKEDQGLSTTTLGKLSSFYYLSHETIQHLGEKIKSDSQIDQLIKILSDSKEFSGLPVRHNEDVLNEALTHLVPIKVPKHELESPHVKSNLLLQAHFERCPLPITDFITDTKMVLDQSIRIIQGMIDVSTHKGFMNTTKNLVHMIQMIIQGQWIDQSPLINVPGFEDGIIIRKLANIGVFYLPQLIARAEGNIKFFFDKHVQHPLPFEDLKDIFKALEKVPLVKLQYSVARTNARDEILTAEPLQEGQEACLMVNLNRVNRSQKQYVSISNFPKAKECSWFLLVCVQGTNELLAMSRISFKRFASKKITIKLPKDFNQKLEVHLMCDSYIGLDQCYTLDLNQINDAIMMEAKAVMDEAEATENGRTFNPVDTDQIENEGFAIDYEDQLRQQKPGELTSENKNLFSIFGQGFSLFDNLRSNIVDDVPSDDEVKRPKISVQQLKTDDSDGDQIDTGGGQINTKNSVQSNIFKDLDMLLDSDEDEQRREQAYAEDGMIEKDLDNFF